MTSWTIESTEFSRPEYWSGEPFPSPGDLPNPGTEPQVSRIAGGFFTSGATREAQHNWKPQQKVLWNLSFLIRVCDGDTIIVTCVYYQYTHTGASLLAQAVKNLPAMWAIWVRPPGWKDLLEEGMAVFLPGESPWTEQPGRLQSTGSQRVGHNRATKPSIAHTQVRRGEDRREQIGNSVPLNMWSKSSIPF